MTTMSWDVENHLKKIEPPVGGVVTNVYDPDGLRERREDASGAVDFVWDEERLLQERDSGGLLAAYASTPGLYGETFMRTTDTVTEFFHPVDRKSVV